MNKRACFAVPAMAVAALGLGDVPAMALSPFSIQQIEMIQTRTSGEGYAIGFARNFGTVLQNDVGFTSSRGLGFNFSNNNVFGSSEAFGIASSVNGQSSVNVISAQSISNMVGGINSIVR
jgi:hypothetical protein